MIYKYYKVTSKISRPIIPIILKSSSSVSLYSALVDSGADHCIFSLDIADAMGIKLRSKDKTKISGIGKEEVDGFWSQIEFRIGGKIYSTKVIFAKINEYGYGILGQNGFFDHFDVKLSHQKQTIEIEPVRLYN